MVRTILLVFAVGCGHAAEAPRQASASPTATAGITFRHGVVVNHWLASNYDEVHRYGGAWFDREDVAWIARHGFDHIRFRVAPHAWLRPDGTLDPAKLAPLDAALAWAAAEQVGVVIALTGFPGMPERDPDLGDPAVPAAAARIWLALARRYAATGEQLRFELLHSPPAKSAAVLPAVHAAALAAVRAVSPRRFVYLGVPE
ncbi:MAG: cellulase family glycosylhydrolase [Kofleriaceae bacterium]